MEVKQSNKRVLITSALPYVNNVPHLGNIIGCVLPADVYSRYIKGLGKECLYICGADEYGTCTEIKAREEGVLPREICDKYIELHKKIYEWFQIDFDYFGRTSTSDPIKDIEWNHTKISQEIFIKLANNDCLIEKEINQLFCKEINRFVSDRFVTGECPNCSYSKANGDQCDGCQQLLNAIDIVNPLYKLNDSYKLEMRTTNHLFLNLTKFQPQLRAWVDTVKNNWSKNAIQTTESWLSKGLLPRCITRDLDWGTPVPRTDKYGDKYCGKVMYNWFDAPIGYISITSNMTDDWKKWWMDPENVDLVNFYGQDNCLFHTLIFPASLMGTGDNYTLVNKTSSVYYLTYLGGKFSKSESIGIFGDDAMDSGIDSDIWRFYLLAQRPENKSTEFSWYDLVSKVNELNDNIGNLCYRVMTFTFKRFAKQIPDFDTELLNDVDKNYINELSTLTGKYHEHMNNLKLKQGLEIIMELGRASNKYIFMAEPWKTYKNNLSECTKAIHILNHVVIHIANLMSPFTPESAGKIKDIYNIEQSSALLDFDFKLQKYNNQPINKPEILFKKMEEKQIKEWLLKYGNHKK